MQLQQYLEKNGISCQEFADEMGLRKNTLYNWLSGKSIPLKIYRDMIEEATNGNVTNKDWNNGPKKTPDKRQTRIKINGLHNTKHILFDKKAVSKGSKKK